MMLELNRVYLMDCMEGMAQIPDKYFELAIVDPPYGIGASTQNASQFNYSTPKWKNAHCENLSIKKWDMAIPPRSYFESLMRVSTNQIIWGGNFFIDYLRNTPAMIVWDKKVPPDFNKANAELAWSSFGTSVKMFRFLWHGFQRGEQVERIHPTQKPIALYKWLLSNYAKPSDKILDTHVGSGSSIIACIDMGFEYMGFEIDADYYKAMEDRIYHFTRQRTLDLGH